MLFTTSTKRPLMILLAALAFLGNAQCVLAQSASEARLRETIIQGWQQRISAHRVCDPQMAALEEQIMNAQLAKKTEETGRLTAMLMDLQAQRTPCLAAPLHRQAEIMLSAERLKQEISADCLAGRQAQALAKQRQLWQLAKDSAFALSSAGSASPGARRPIGDNQ